MSISVLMIAVLVMLTACNNTGSNASGKQSTLDFLWFSDGNEGEVVKQIIKDYEQNNSNVKINLIEVGFKDIQTKLKTMLSGGKPPALSRVTDTGSLRIRRLILPLMSKMRNNSRINLSIPLNLIMLWTTNW